MVGVGLGGMVGAGGACGGCGSRGVGWRVQWMLGPALPVHTSQGPAQSTARCGLTPGSIRNQPSGLAAYLQVGPLQQLWREGCGAPQLLHAGVPRRQAWPMAVSSPALANTIWWPSLAAWPTPPSLMPVSNQTQHSLAGSAQAFWAVRFPLCLLMGQVWGLGRGRLQTPLCLQLVGLPG